MLIESFLQRLASLLPLPAQATVVSLDPHFMFRDALLKHFLVIENEANLSL
jgi:hypothetical protein